MSRSEHDHCYKQYLQCQAHYDKGKFTECTKLGLSNLSDPKMPRYLQIKTLVLLVGAENDSWEEAEEYRVRAERAYASTKELMIQKLPNMSAATRAADEEGMRQLRESFDNMLEYQANEAPRSISLRYGQYPGREGNMVDYLYARRMFESGNDHDGKEMPVDDEAESEDEEMDERMSEEPAEMEAHQPSKDIQLSGNTTAWAADTEVLSGDGNIT